MFIATQMQTLPSASEPTEHPRTFELRKIEHVQPTCVLVTKRNSYSRITNPSCTFMGAELVVTHATTGNSSIFGEITLPTCLWETEEKAI
jgi:hypothetical protein